MLVRTAKPAHRIRIEGKRISTANDRNDRTRVLDRSGFEERTEFSGTIAAGRSQDHEHP